MIVSKLSATAFPMKSPAGRLIVPGTTGDIDPVFAWRTAAFAAEHGGVVMVTSKGGSRTTEEQIALYLRNGGRQTADGEWVGGNGLAAKPGVSWHQFALAFDTSSCWVKSLHRHDATPRQTELTRFGLFKPLTTGNGIRSATCEDWHHQPIETAGVPVARRSSMAPLNVDLGVRTFQRAAGLEPDGVYGPKTMAAATEWFIRRGRSASAALLTIAGADADAWVDAFGASALLPSSLSILRFAPDLLRKIHKAPTLDSTDVSAILRNAGVSSLPAWLEAINAAGGLSGACKLYKFLPPLIVKMNAAPKEE